MAAFLRHLPPWVITGARACIRGAGLCASTVFHGRISHISNQSPEEARAFCEKYSPRPSPTPIAERSPDARVDLSVIIPVYNAAGQLKGCLDSIFSQKTDFSFEVIAVDDKSSDESLRLLRETRDERLIVYPREKNGGSARARNDGLNLSKGRFILFVDADDRLTPGAIETLLSAARTEGADIVQGQYASFSSEQDAPVPARRYPARALQANAVGLCGYPGVPWMKAFTRELWQSVNFLEGNIYEDTVIWYLVFPRARKFACVPETVYAYRRNPGGITASSRSKPKAADAYWAVEESLRLRDAMGLKPDDTAYHMTLMQFGNLLFSRNANAGDEALESLFVLASELTAALRGRLERPPVVRGACLRALERALLKRDFGSWRFLARLMV